MNMNTTSNPYKINKVDRQGRIGFLFFGAIALCLTTGKYLCNSDHQPPPYSSPFEVDGGDYQNRKAAEISGIQKSDNSISFKGTPREGGEDNNNRKLAEILRKSENSISFKGTAKDVSPQPGYGPANYKKQTIEDAMKQSKALQEGFKNANHKGLLEGWMESVKSTRGRRGMESENIINATVIQSSQPRTGKDSFGAEYGFISAVWDAYNYHYNLVIRPDDVWQAILTQFSFYVNANGEALRSQFVDFKEGKMTLVIDMGMSSLFSTDFATFANRMVDEKIVANIKDPEVADWLLPSFTTTTPNDRVAASVTIMATLQSYFEYVSLGKCGIPEVTLEGTVEDWRKLRAKIDRLPRYDLMLEGNVMSKWHGMLAPVLDEMVASAEGNPKVDFWDRIVNVSGGSGSSDLSGWITVFACFTTDGTWRGDIPKGRRGHGPWPVIGTDNLSSGAVSVPVLVDDNGIQYDTLMVAGQVVYEMPNKHTIQSRTDWCIAYQGKPRAIPKHYKDGEIKIVD